MQTVALQKPDWQKTFDDLYRKGKEKAHRITIEVASEGMGTQKEVENVGFQGVSYDPKDDLVAVDTDNIEHLINHPTKIEMAVSGEDLVCIEVNDNDGLRHLLYFMPPLRLSNG